MTERAVPVAPILVGPHNVEAACGLSWRESLALAKRLGVRVVELGERRVILARELLAALDRLSGLDGRAADIDPESVVLARLGRR